MLLVKVLADKRECGFMEREFSKLRQQEFNLADINQSIFQNQKAQFITPSQHMQEEGQVIQTPGVNRKEI